MNRPSGGTGDLARGVGASAVKGAVLIGLAVIVGVFLLQRNDSGTSGSAAGGVTSVTTHRTTTTTVKRTATTRPSVATETTQPAAPAKTPDQLKVLVLNGGAPNGAARNLRSALQRVGYTNQPQASQWSGHSQTGKSILCRTGLAREAVALAQQTVLQGAKVSPFPSPAPPSSDGVDCVIVVGA